ncbi:MAG: hypothetical protein O3B72_11080 [Proteobacteria bacterium]|nr:hypothetical protein [Pseudomonadota bacterium]
MDGTRSLTDIVNELKTRGFAELPADHPAKSFADRDIPELMTTAANCLVQFRNNALIH